MVRELYFSLDLTLEQALSYYQGRTRFIIVTAQNGQRIRFPAEHIRPFIDQSGVQGHFRIQFDNNNKLISLKRR